MAKESKVKRRLQLQEACRRHPLYIKDSRLDSEEKIIIAATHILNELADIKEAIEQKYNAILNYPGVSRIPLIQ
jgi:hypothetical protein